MVVEASSDLVCPVIPRCQHQVQGDQGLGRTSFDQHSKPYTYFTSHKSLIQEVCNIKFLKMEKTL